MTPNWLGCEKWINDWFLGIQKGYAIGDPKKKFILLAVALRETNQVIGQINIGRKYDEYLHGELSISYFISEKYINNGFATEAVKAITSYAFDKYGYDFVMAVVKSKNLASARVLEKSGFKYITDTEISEQNVMILFHYYRLYNALN